MAKYKRERAGNASVNLEEKLDEAIFYSLSILKKKFSTSPEFDKVFTKNMFIKKNTKAFIHVTHYLFDIYDPKEFKKRFYWPIFDKTAENSYRSSVVEYINHLIDKQKLKMEKIKMHMVVLPGSVKFMEFLLRLINFVLKEVMERSKTPKNRSIYLEEAVKKHQEMVEVGNAINTSVKQQITLISERNQSIDKLIYEKIFMVNNQSALNGFSVENFIPEWHAFNKHRASEINLRKDKMRELYQKASDLFKKVDVMLEPKKREISYDQLSVEETIGFFRNQYRENPELFENYKIESRISFKNLLDILQLILPDIVTFMRSFQFANPEAIKYESTEVMKLYKQVHDVSSEISLFHKSYFMKLQASNTNTLNEEGARCLLDEIPMKSYLISTPRLAFDCTENCVENPLINKKNRLPLVESSDSPLTRTKLFQISRINTPRAKERSFDTSTTLKRVPEKETKSLDKTVFNQPPSRRRNARDILCKATNLNRQKSPQTLLPTKFNQLSSTMLSPDRRQYEIPNISGISSISSTISPIIEEEKKPIFLVENKNIQKTLTIQRTQQVNSPVSSKPQKHIYSEVFETSTTLSPDSIIYNQRSSINSIIHLARNDTSHPNHMKAVQLSPSGKLDALVLHENIPKILLSSLDSPDITPTNREMSPVSSGSSTLKASQTSNSMMENNQNPKVFAEAKKSSTVDLVTDKENTISKLVNDFKGIQLNEEIEWLGNISDSILMDVDGMD